MDNEGGDKWSVVGKCQGIDGDCGIESGWVSAKSAYLSTASSSCFFLLFFFFFSSSHSICHFRSLSISLIPLLLLNSLLPFSQLSSPFFSTPYLSLSLFSLISLPLFFSLLPLFLISSSSSQRHLSLSRFSLISLPLFFSLPPLFLISLFLFFFLFFFSFSPDSSRSLSLCQSRRRFFFFLLLLSLFFLFLIFLSLSLSILPFASHFSAPFLLFLVDPPLSLFLFLLFPYIQLSAPSLNLPGSPFRLSLFPFLLSL